MRGIDIFGCPPPCIRPTLSGRNFLTQIKERQSGEVRRYFNRTLQDEHGVSRVNCFFPVEKNVLEERKKEI